MPPHHVIQLRSHYPNEDYEHDRGSQSGATMAMIADLHNMSVKSVNFGSVELT